MRDAIEVREADVRERGENAFRVPELGAVAERHRARRVEHEVDREVLFFLEEAHEELVELLVDVPVEATEVVTGLVLAVVGELDTGAGLFGAAFGAHPPRHAAPADEGEHLQFALELVVEELVVGDRRRFAAAEDSLEQAQVTPSRRPRRSP